MKNKYKILLSTLFSLLPVISGLLISNKLPNKLVIGFGFGSGTGDTMGKFHIIFSLPIFMLLTTYFIWYVIKMDRYKKGPNPMISDLVLWLVPAISNIIALGIYSNALKINVNIPLISDIVVGLIFIFIGWYLPKLNQENAWAYKNKHTLKNDEIWSKTHKFAGILWLLCGIIEIIASILNIYGAFIPLILIAFISPMFYSSFIDKK